MKKTLAAALMLGLGLASAAVALTYVHVSDESLARQAEVIALVEVLDSAVDAGGDRGISTRYTMWLDEVVKGQVGAGSLMVRVPGGLAPELGVELRYDGAPRFSAGEKALLFLRPNQDGTYRVLHFVLGAFWQRQVDGASVFVRDLPEPVAGTTKSTDAGRDAERFLDWLRDEVAGRRPEADYLVALSDRDRSLLRQEKFTVFEPLQSWGEFRGRNQPQRVDWERHKSGQKGVPRKGKKELKKITKVLSKTKNAEGTERGLVKLKVKGKFKKPPDIARACVQENVFVFNDAVGLIRDDFNCVDFGILAVGGACRTVAAVGKWKGRNVHNAVSGRISFNKGSECYYRGDAPFGFDTASNKFAEVAMHELLHAMGLVHSCGDDNSPRCSTSEVLDDATMRANVHADGRGAELRQDDLAGFWFLYDPDFLAAPCHLPPGHKKFCKKCGPCGEGQGRCKKNKECFDGLTCKPDPVENFKTCQ